MDGTQIYGKAYPGLRELEVMKGIGNSGVLASICAKNTTAVSSMLADDAFGYNPALSAFVDRIGPAFSPGCLPLPLPLAVSAANPVPVACHVAEIEADIADGDTCDCATHGLSNANSAVSQKAYADLQSKGLCGSAPLPACERYCVCELPELTGDTLTSCLNDPNYAGTDTGYCYVDPAQNAGSALVVESCPATRKRVVRFSGDAPSAGATPFVDCAPADQ
jgi:hypothetical protein